MSQVATVPKLSSRPDTANLDSLSPGVDALIVLYTSRKNLLQHSLLREPSTLGTTIEAFSNIDEGFDRDAHIIPHAAAPGGRVVLACTGGLSGDVDDVRRYADAAAKAYKRAFQAGVRYPAVVIADPSSLPGYEHHLEVTLLSLLHEAYIPLQTRELLPKTLEEDLKGIEVLLSDKQDKHDQILKRVEALELGRRIARDLGASDPERIAPKRFANYVQEAFQSVSDVVEVTIIDDRSTLEREYPLFAAVGRCSQSVERHHPCIVRLQYRAPDPTKVKDNLYFIGKGVTYDTGGADVKAGGAMRGMSRDKCGAAGVAGFMRTVAAVRPAQLNITASLALVRNSIGANSYVSDEIIKARSGARVIVGNTDAEGRLAMTDLLCQAREEVLAARAKGDPTPASLFTVATLTGHVIRAYGHYGAAVPNGPSRQLKVAERLQEAGEQWGDPFEISTLRREDIDQMRGVCGTGDAVSSNNAPSTMTSRGHQLPTGFMIIASGLEHHGLDQEDPSRRIAYTHLDVAGSAEESTVPGLGLPRTTGSPILTLAGVYLWH